MTRRCMDCKIEIGEKCPACGSENLTSTIRWIDVLGKSTQRIRIFICRDLACGHLLKHHRRREFVKGEGGVTHGLCQRCLADRRAELGRLAEARV